MASSLGRFGNGCIFTIKKRSTWVKLARAVFHTDLQTLTHPQNGKAPRNWFNNLYSSSELSKDLGLIVSSEWRKFAAQKEQKAIKDKAKGKYTRASADKLSRQYSKEFEKISANKMAEFLNGAFATKVIGNVNRIFKEMSGYYFGSRARDDRTRFDRSEFSSAIEAEVRSNIAVAAKQLIKTTSKVQSEKLLSDKFLGFADPGNKKSSQPMVWAHHFIAGHLGGSGTLLLWMTADRIKKLDSFLGEKRKSRRGNSNRWRR